MDAFGGLHQPLAEGKGVAVRQGLDAQRLEANLRLEEHEAHTRLSKSGELARNNKAQCNQGLWEVNATSAQGKPMFLPGETCCPAFRVTLVVRSD